MLKKENREWQEHKACILRALQARMSATYRKDDKEYVAAMRAYTFIENIIDDPRQRELL